MADKTPTDILIAAMERVEECDSVIVVMQRKEGGMIFYENDLTLERASFMARAFDSWIMRHMCQED